MKDWKSINCSRKELRLDISLVNGQSFRWQETKPGEWTSVLADRVFTLSQSEDLLLYRINGGCQRTVDEDREDEKILRDYFQLGVDLGKLYQGWCKIDPNFQSKASNFLGTRTLRQYPVENLFSFICSSNNNISRISQMVDKMCRKFGDKVLELDEVTYHSFPTIDALAEDSVEQTLRDLGFGYRAKFIAGSAKYIKQNWNSEWTWELREKSYEDAKCELIKLPGVGAKVADCVCLMSLDKPAATPVDTHVWQIVTRDYPQAGLTSNKSLTDKIYKEIGDYFHDLWGDHAGWAQSVLFTADLKKFQESSIHGLKTGGKNGGKRKTSNIKESNSPTDVKPAKLPKKKSKK